MKTYKVEAAKPFQYQLEAEQSWWYANREKNPFALDDELEVLLDRIALNPWSGQQIAGYSRNVRSMLLRKTLHRVAFVVDDDDIVVRLLAIWGAREQAPRIDDKLR